MADDKLKIVATVEDQFTGPLGKLKKELDGVGAEAKKQGANWRKDWDGLRGDVQKFQGVLGGFEPILSKIGIGGFGAALSVAGVVTALKGFSGSTRDLNQMAKQIGLTANELRTLSELGGKVGVSTETMRGAINQFAGNMVDLRQRWGQAYGELKNMNLGKLAEELVNAPNMEAAIERAMEGLRGIPDPQKRARVSMLLFGTPDIGVVASSLNGPIRDAVKRLQAELGTLDKSTLEAAERFEQNLNRMHNRWEKLKLKTLGPLLEGADKAIEEVEKERRAAPSRERQDQIRRQLDVLDESISRKRMNGDEAGAAETQKKRDALAAEMQRLTDEIRKLREQGGASVSPTGYGGPASGGGSLIQKAAWGGFGASSGAGAAIPAYGSPGGAGGAGGGSGSGVRDVPAGPDLGDGIRGRPFGSKGPVGGRSGPLSPGQGANPGDYKEVLDFIARNEGTAGRDGDGYSTSLAYGRLLPGGVEQNLTGKTLDQIDALQTQMLRNPANRWNSSAIGRYQIVRTTLRRLRKKLGLHGNALYDEKMQDRLAAELARARGADPHGLGQEWASLGGERGRRAAELMRQVPRTASTTPGSRPSGSARRAEVLADPNDERRRPDEDGVHQVTPWRKAPAGDSSPTSAAIPPTRVDASTGQGIYAGTGALRSKPTPRRKGERFADYLKRQEKAGARFGQWEGETIPDEGRVPFNAHRLNDWLDTNRKIGPNGDAETAAGERYRDLQGHSNDPAYKPDRELTLDEIRQFRGPNRKVGDALMDRFYGEGAAAGGSAMQMPGGSGGGGKGSLHIKVDGPPGTQVKADMSDLFGDTTVSHGKSQMNLYGA